MFSFFTSNSDSTQSNTFILNQTISPKVSYDELQKEMQDLFEKNKLKESQYSKIDNSLTQYWELSKQESWNLYKNISIKLALHYLKTKNFSILELYAFLGDCRNIIAKNLQQKHADELGKTREVFIKGKKNVTPEQYLTHLNYTGMYSSFAKALVKKYRDNWGSYRDNIEIKIDDVAVSDITLNDYKEHALVIGHCIESEKAFNLLNKKINEEYEVFLKCSEEKDIFESIAKIAYYFTLAMPLCRGSAATTEMLIQVLFKGKGLNVKYTDTTMILDLHAYLSKDINEFVEIFSRTHTNTGKPSKKRVDAFFKTENDGIFANLQSVIEENNKKIDENCTIS